MVYPITSRGGLQEAAGKSFMPKLTALAATNLYSKNSAFDFLLF